MQYAIEYDAFAERFFISLNKRDLSRDVYSNFARYGAMPFERWVWKLADECSSTANARYDVCFTGSALHGGIVEELLRSSGMLKIFQLKDPIITSEHRLNYALSKGALQLPELYVYNTGAGVRLPESVLLCPGAAFRIKEVRSPEQAQAILLSSCTEAASVRLADAEKRMCAAVAADSGGPVVREVQNGLCVMTGGVEQCLKLWYREMLLPQSLRSFAQSLKQDDRDVLLTDKPVYGLGNIPDSRDHMKVGQSRIVEVVKFPPDVECSLQYSGHVEFAKHARGLEMRMMAEGQAEIALSVDADAQLPAKRYSFSVYQDHPVTAIRNVTVSRDPIIVGDSFEISFGVLPANATNTGDLVWEISDSSVLSRNQGQGMGLRGRFNALREGKCNVTIRIGQTSFVQGITVCAAAAGLSARESRMSIKENNQSGQWKVSIEPRGSRGGQIVYSSLERSIVEVDSSGKLYPRTPGRTEIIAELLDHRNQVKASKRLDIEVLPTHSNPDFVQFIGVAALIVTIGLAVNGSDYGILSGTAALIVFGISYFTSRFKNVRTADIVLGLVTILIMLILSGS